MTATRHVQQLDVRNTIAREALDVTCDVTADLLAEAKHSASALQEAAKVLRECGRPCLATAIEHQLARQNTAIAKAEGRTF